MKQLTIIIIGLTLTSLTFGQTIKFQGGISISNLDWTFTMEKLGPLYNETLIGYSIFMGADYLDKKYFNLSSNIGMIRKGGKGEVQLSDHNGILLGQTIIDKAALDYLSLNTTFDVKYKIKELVAPFISVGPRVDYLFNWSNQFDGLEEINKLNKISAGLILGAGLRFDVSNMELGLRADYYLDFTKVAEWTGDLPNFSGEIKTNTFTLNLTIGYKL